MDTYSIGMAAVVWVVTFIAVFVTTLDAVADFRGWPTVSEQIGAWAADNPWLARGVVCVLFVLLAHFTLNPLHPLACPCVP